DHPAAGAISEGGTLGPAAGVITVVKTTGSPNYLISYEIGSLVAREIGATEGDFLASGDLSLSFAPKAIVFDEDSQRLLVIPPDPNIDLVQIRYDTSTGTFAVPVTYSQTGADDPVEGVSFSPEGAFMYYSQTNKLLRIPTAEPTSAPEELP